MYCDSINEIIDFIGILAAFLAFVVAFSQLLVKDKKPINYVIALFYLSFSFTTVSYSMEVSGKMNEYPHLLGLSWPFHTLIVGTFYIYVKILITPTYRLLKRDSLCLLPSLLYFLCLVPTVYLKSADEKLKILTAYYEWDLISFLNLVFFNITTAFLTVMAINKLRIIFRKESLRNIKSFRITFVLMVISIVGLLLNCIGLILGNALILRIDMLVFSLVIFTPFFLGYRYPNFMQNLSREISQEKYKQSQINGLNIPSVVARLTDMFESEKVFTDPELSVSKLSELLGVSSHQLSEIFNDRLKTSYAAFVSNHRVEEAKSLLIGNADLSILQVGFAAGFKSKSSFNLVFKRITNLTPSEFRKLHEK